jgi:hypothetical protein
MWMEVFMTEDGGVITRKTTIYTILAQTSWKSIVTYVRPKRWDDSTECRHILKEIDSEARPYLILNWNSPEGRIRRIKKKIWRCKVRQIEMANVVL